MPAIKNILESVFGRPRAGMFPRCRPAGISISFDDSYVDEWYCLKDLFAEYGATVTFFVSNFDLLPEKSIEKLKILRDDGHEIAFHGLRHLSAGKFIRENSLAGYLEAEILPGIDAMARRGFPPATFSYPYGVRAPYIDDALLKYFKHVRAVACTNSKKRLSGLKQIYCKNAGGLVFAAGIDNIYGNSLEEIRDALIKTMGKKKTILLYAHRPTSEPGDYCTPVPRLQAVLEYASECGLKFLRVRDL